MQAQFAALAKQMEAARTGPMVTDNAAAYNQQLQKVNELRPAMQQLMQATNGYTVETVKSVSASQALTKSIMDGKINVGSAIKNWDQFRSTLKQVANDQAALQKATVVGWSKAADGTTMADVFLPTNAIATAQQRMGVYLNTLKAGSQAIQDWGKNTQWAGRQITAGFTMPLALASAGLIKLGTDMDAELTKITKMYNTQDLEQKYSDPAQLAIAKEQELSAVRKDAYANAINMAKQYGSAVNDTLEIEAQLASKGFTGTALQTMTDQTMKVASVGAISSSDAMNLIMSATSAFKIPSTDLGDAMNFLNALKNNTNLTMQDISTSIPKIGATIATLVPSTTDANAALKESGILLAAFAEGGVPAAQGANTLRTALSRALAPVTAANKEFAGLNTQVKEFQGAGGKGISLDKIIANSNGGDPIQLFKNLGQALQGTSNEDQIVALSKLFGLQRSNNMLIAIKNMVDANPSTQTGAAMKLADAGPGVWQDITDQEVTQFQQSASGKLKIAVQTMKGELASLGAPLMGMLTPVVHGLTAIVSTVIKLGQALPGPVKDLLAIGTIGVALLGPLGMIAGIGMNAVGTIGKILAAIGLWKNGTSMQTKEQAVQNALLKDSITANTEAAQSNQELAAKMADVVTIMQERMTAQEKLNELTEAGVSAQDDAAAAADKTASAMAAAADATAAAAVATEANAGASADDVAVGDLDIKSIRDRIIAWRELGQAERQAAADAATASGAAVTGITGAKIGTGGFAVGGNGVATYSAEGSRNAMLAQMLDENGYDASLGYGLPSRSATGTTGRGFTFGPIPVQNGLVGLRGPSGTQNAAKNAANWRRMLDAGSLSEQELNTLNPSSMAANFNSYVNPKNSINVSQATIAAAKNIVTSTEVSLMDELVRMSETPVTSTVPGFRARLAAAASKIASPIYNAATSSFPMIRQGSVDENGYDASLGYGATASAAKNAEEIAAQSEKAGMSWGKIAGNMGALAMGGLMIKDMADGSGSIATNIMQATMAFSMLLPVGGQLLKAIKGLAPAGVQGASALASGWAKAKTSIGNGLSSLASGAKWLFTTGPGLFTVGLVAAGVALYTINEQMTKATRAQEQINQSTQAWSKILGYTSNQNTSLSEMLAKNGTANEASAYEARAKAVNDLTAANQSLVDSLNKAKEADQAAGDKMYTQTYNLALDEALKVKVDGGSTTQAKEAFDVALQAAGLDQTTIHNLDVKIGQINLDDPKQVQQQLSQQIGNTLSGIKPDNIGPGFWESMWDGVKGMWSDNVNNLLSDQTQAAINKAANDTWDAMKSALDNNDKQGMTDVGKGFANSMDTMFQSAFDNIRGSDSKIAQIFKKQGINNIDQLQQAMVAAAQAKNPKDWQKYLLDNVNNNSDYNTFLDAFSTSLEDIGKAAGLSGADLQTFEDKAKTMPGIAQFFAQGINQMTAATQALGDAMQQAPDSITTPEMAGNTDGAIATGQQYAKEMQDAYGGTIQTYTQQVNQAFQQQEQAAASAIQKAGEAKTKALQSAQKDQDQQYAEDDKAITQKYKDLAKQYDDNVKQATAAAKAQTDGITATINALKKEDTTRQDLFNNEKTRLQRLAQMQTNNIDFNAALNSGNLDQAASIYATNQSQVQQNIIDDQQKAMDAQSKAQQDALQNQIDSINAQRDAYVQAQNDMKASLSDREQAEHDSLTKQKQAYDDAMQAQIDATNTATQNAVTMSNNRYQKDKEAIDLQVAAITAYVPQSVAQVNSQISQINAAYGGYGNQLKLYGKDWANTVGTDLSAEVTKASNSLQSDIGWAQIGTWIQTQIDQGAGFTLDQALQFLKTGQWPAMANNQPAAQPWKPSPAQQKLMDTVGAPTAGNEMGFKMYANHIGGLAGANELSLRSRAGISPNAPIQSSEYLTLMQHGEYVVKKSAADKNRALLDAINNGHLPAGGMLVRHDGGPIGTNVVTSSAFLKADVMTKAAKAAASEAYSSALMAKAGGGGPYIGQMTQSITNALQFARSQQGKPYIWGGAGPAGQDCSGFISVVYNYLTGHSPKGNTVPWGRDWVTQSFTGGREFGPWKRGNGPTHAFRIGVDPGSHMAGTLGGINIESGSGHGPMVGGRALGSSSGFQYQYYLPVADLPQLRNGGRIQYDNTLANLHKDETVLTAPLTKAFEDNVLASGKGSSYNVENVNVYGPFNSQIDFEQGVANALYSLDNKAGRNRTIG